MRLGASNIKYCSNTLCANNNNSVILLTLTDRTIFVADILDVLFHYSISLQNFLLNTRFQKCKSIQKKILYIQILERVQYIPKLVFFG